VNGGAWGRAAARALLATLALAFVAIGVLRVRDAHHRWETPRWDARAFHVLRHGGDSVRTGETWVVPVNPSCPSCLALLARTTERAHDVRPRPRLVALLVDTSERRALDAVWRIGTDTVAWDEDEVWRRRWGGRRYGEVLRFDAAGAFVRPARAGRVAVTAANHEPPRRGR
jgi:hypothetical protein